MSLNQCLCDLRTWFYPAGIEPTLSDHSYIQTFQAHNAQYWISRFGSTLLPCNREVHISNLGLDIEYPTSGVLHNFLKPRAEKLTSTAFSSPILPIFLNVYTHSYHWHQINAVVDPSSYIQRLIPPFTHTEKYAVFSFPEVPIDP
jgi:hypothetical protein